MQASAAHVHECGHDPRGTSDQARSAASLYLRRPRLLPPTGAKLLLAPSWDKPSSLITTAPAGAGRFLELALVRSASAFCIAFSTAASTSCPCAAVRARGQTSAGLSDAIISKISKVLVESYIRIKL